MAKHILWTGQTQCFDSNGVPVSCRGTGQDGEYTPGRQWSRPRFVKVDTNLVHDTTTDLVWPLDANLFSFPMSWQEGLDAVRQMNSEKRFGRTDWRLPNRRELRSLISHGARKPALPRDHPFHNVFLGWYWTSTSFAKAREYAWYVHMEGGRMFYGKKIDDSLVWPVCGESSSIPRSGQTGCFDQKGREIACPETGQDGDLLRGAAWPFPRFGKTESGVLDTLTGCIWHPDSACTQAPVTWDEALAAVQTLAKQTGLSWRMPTINELESLVDASRHSPALPAGHPFADVTEAYWSSTTSFFEPDWAYVLYMHKGAVGVGFKKNRDFSLLPVR
ncbi:MAG: hypothetical protein VR65_27400 [Desulfobulbaceae bacterium BRH_c16a]|nr:MAG: hypothetical protein VR65_27400 [Desulfobulbaceae bacterium BRH_c16a]